MGQAPTTPALCELVTVRRPDVIFLFETLSYGVRLEKLQVKLKFSNCFSVDCMGRSGGLAIFWRDNNTCYVVSYSMNHIDLNVVNKNGD